MFSIGLIAASTVALTVLLHATGVEALNGVILLGWSTALSFAVIQRAWAGREHG